MHGLPSSQLMAPPATHLPPAQVSPAVQTLLSLHGAVLLADWHPKETSQVSVVHGLPSSHLLGPLGVQTPPLQVSPTVQLLLSLQTATLSTCTQPLIAPHESSVHGLPSSQATLVPGTHCPAAQASPTVQTLLSEHGTVLATLLQPLRASQPSVVHKLLSSHDFATPGWHLPPPQTSPTVQTLLSVHTAELAVLWQPLAASQLSSVHKLPSSQLMALPGAQLPPLQVSPAVQTEPSSQALLLLLLLQPLMASQESVVQLLLSLQSLAGPGTQAVSLHVSVVVQTLPSLHGATLAT